MADVLLPDRTPDLACDVTSRRSPEIVAGGQPLGESRRHRRPARERDPGQQDQDALTYRRPPDKRTKRVPSPPTARPTPTPRTRGDVDPTRHCPSRDSTGTNARPADTVQQGCNPKRPVRWTWVGLSRCRREVRGRSGAGGRRWPGPGRPGRRSRYRTHRRSYPSPPQPM